MKLQDYIRYYIGCRCIAAPYGGQPNRFEEGFIYGTTLHVADIKLNKWQSPTTLDFDKIKLILRKLEDITDEERNEYNKLMWTVYSINKHQDQIKTDAATTTYLIDQGFDLFGLIEADLAIDSKTLK